MLLIYEKIYVGPWVVQYLNNNLKFPKYKKNKENHDFTILTGVPMATLDA